MHRLVLAGLVPALVAAAGGAQDRSTVTETEFLSVLDESHPAVAEAAEQLNLARSRVVAASTLENPSGTVVREDPDGPVEQTDYLLSWKLPDAARGPTVEAREATVEAAGARLSQRLLDLRLRMRATYAEWALARARRTRLSVQADRVEALSEREARRAERGEASGLEARRLELAAAALCSRVALSSAGAERAEAEARRWHPTLPPDARPVIPEVPDPPELETGHPLLRAAEADLAAASLQDRAAGRFLASPELTLGWQRQEAGAEVLEGPILGLSWSLPLFDRNRAERAAAEARIAGAEARLEAVRRRITASREAARAAFSSLSESLAEAETALVESGEMLDGAEAAFRLGETSLTDLLETHRSVTEGHLAVLDLRAETLAAHRELERLAGPDDRPDDPPDATRPSDSSDSSDEILDSPLETELQEHHR